MIGAIETSNGSPRRYMSDVLRSTEYYNALLRNLRLDANGNGSASVHAVGISSVIGCSKTSVVATNLAICMAQATKEGSVLLINANPANRAPEISFSLRDSMGIYDVIHGGVPVDDAIVVTGVPNLSAIGSGRNTDETISVSCLERFRAVLAELKRQYATIVVDLPVATELTPCFDMAAQLDGVVIAVESSRVSRDVARATLDNLRFVNAEVLGCVFLDD